MFCLNNLDKHWAQIIFPAVLVNDLHLYYMFKKTFYCNCPLQTSLTEQNKIQNTKDLVFIYLYVYD